MSKTLYISDLDGTLLDKTSKVTETSAEMLNRAIAAGALFSVATARTPATVSPLLSKVDLRIPAVVMTGVTLWNPALDIYTHIHHFRPDVVRKVREVYRRCGLPYFLYTLPDTGRPHTPIRIYHSGPLSPGEKKFIDERRHSPFKMMDIPDNGCSDIPDCVEDAVLFFAMQPTELSEPAYLLNKEVEGVNPIFYGDPAYGPELAMSEAFPKGVSKAEAARRLAAETGADRIVAFGDNVNDLPLMRVADVAVAVGNAIPEVKREADIIIGPHDSDAVARFILEQTAG